MTLAIAPYVGNRDSHEKGLSATLYMLAVAAVDWLRKTPEKGIGRLSGQIQPLASLQLRPRGDVRALPVVLGSSVQRELVQETLGFGSTYALPVRVSAPLDLHQTAQGRRGRNDFHQNRPSVLPSVSLPGESKNNDLVTEGDSSDSDSSDDGAGGPSKFKPWAMKRASTANSTATPLVPSTPGGIGGLAPPLKFKANGGVKDYSDVEVDVTAAAAKMTKEEKEREKERRTG